MATARPLNEQDFWPSAIDQAATPANNNCLRDEVAIRLVLSFEATQPGDPEEGDLHIISGDWGITFVDPDGASVGYSGLLAYYRDGAWSYWIPSLGMLKRVGSTDYYTYDPDSSGEWQSFSVPGSAAWGSITGTLSSQADLQAALDAKANPGIAQNSQSGAYTLVLSDANKHLLHPSADTTARTFTIPANASVAFPIGTAVTFVNQNAAGVITIAITSDTMRLAGAGTTGSRTLAANGMATALKITATEWIISGTGLT